MSLAAPRNKKTRLELTCCSGGAPPREKGGGAGKSVENLLRPLNRYGKNCLHHPTQEICQGGGQSAHQQCFGARPPGTLRGNEGARGSNGEKSQRGKNGRC